MIDAISKLIQRMAEEHFVTEKEKTVFVVNNLDFMVSQLTSLSLKKSKKDIEVFQKNLEVAMEKLINVSLNLNFEDLFKISSQFIAKETEDENIGINLFTDEKLSQINSQDLEKVGKEFLKSYK